MIYFLTERDAAGPGALDIPRGMPEYLDGPGAALADRIQLLYYEELASPTRSPGIAASRTVTASRDVSASPDIAASTALDFAAGTYIISAFDQLTNAGQQVTRSLCDALVREAARGVRVLNRPGKALTRFELLNTLRATGRNAHGAARVSGDLSGLRYPVFLRSEWQHHGAASPLLQSHAELDRAVGELVLRGHSLDDLLAVEYIDTADSAGMYRKYAAFVVGGAIIARSLAYGASWMLKHDSTEFSMAMAVEERDYLVNNPHEAPLRDIFALAGIEYGRIDYAMRGDAIEVWEINLNPTIGRGRRPSKGKIPASLQAVRAEGRDVFYERFARALAALDAGPLPGPPIRVQIDPAMRHVPMVRRGTARLGFARAVFRMFRPVLEPVARVLFPLVGRLLEGRRRDRHES